MDHGASDTDRDGRACKRRRLNLAVREDENDPSLQHLSRTSQELVKHRGHRIDNVVLHDTAGAHLGDSNITNNYYAQVRPQLGTHKSPYRTLLASLTFDRMDARIRNVATALPRTCNWLPLHHQFLTWIDDEMHKDHGFLWIKGKPGSGKSTIMKETLAWAQKQWPSQTIVSYFFNARSPHLLEKSSLGLYRSLLHQLLCKIPGSDSLFTAEFQSKIRENTIEEWTEIELQNFLVRLATTTRTQPITVFIDALDEGADEDIRQMIRYLERLIQHATAAACPLRICLSSRHYPHINVAKSLSLIVEDQAEHYHDIELYIHSQLLGEDPDMNSLRQNIRQRSAGIFLWVVLVVTIMNKAFDQGNSVAALRRKLNELPPGLHDLFTQILLKDATDIDKSITLLQWVLFAERPLSPIELYHAVLHTHHEDSRDHDKNDISTVVISAVATRYLRNCSRGLVELTKTDEPTVQFIHETVRDYLSSGDMLRQERLVTPLSRYSNRDFRADTCHAKLSEVCLRYLLHNCRHHLLDEDLHLSCPFGSYAAQYWWQHFNSSVWSQSSRVFCLALELLTGSEENLSFWLRLYNIDIATVSANSVFKAYELTSSLSPYDLASPLYYAALIGRHELVSAVLAMDENPNAPGGLLGSPLHAASLKGKERMVEILLDKGADIEASEKCVGTPLYTASVHGHKNVVKILLNNSADVNANARGGDFESALQGASAHGHSTIVQMLLERGANVNVVGEHGTALTVASFKGHKTIVRSLLDEGANVNAAGKFSSALQEASAGGYEEIVQMLISKGADVNIYGVGFGNALQAASAKGHKRIVEMLLDSGANVNARGGYYGTALRAASALDHKAIVQMLLERGTRLT